jgi:hypothetical protein
VFEQVTKRGFFILDNAAAYLHVSDERFRDPLLLKRAEVLDVLKAPRVEMTV